ncbi:glutathione S-transferase [Shewanella hanedai]|uniref:Glutathione S-transferase n=1 Tax=Shewanella hanedai TaxID=25 RepID=A0ZSH7_SHEHA|nr:glutathione S-transferase [Shewanella hanedai]TRY15159.1 glutathione S-transferase [Shewanella hanedai]BAF40900.1 hypothetical protein [Shewanella hanedai]GGI74296.1 glutathione S-transferase [Shewanella hanedai]
MSLATLYSFRRCPYAMRARLGISLSGTQVMLREIILKNKPQQMLYSSPKGTVPVLITSDNQVIDESIDIMCWALMQKDPLNLLLTDKPELQEIAMALIKTNDDNFKPWLDKYKYADRYPEFTKAHYRDQGMIFISHLESLLAKHDNLLCHTASIADYAIYPFVRQFAHVDKMWFETSPTPNVQAWLAKHLASSTFIDIMIKYPTWLDSEEEFVFG